LFTTLDGFIAGPNGEFDDYIPSDEEMRFANEFFRSADGVLFGRVTYEGFVSYWTPST
jgi:dihydrofolate reductase